MFHSGNEFPVKYLIKSLRLKSVESTKDSHGNNLTFFTTFERMRTNQILDKLKKFNQDNPSKALQIDAGLGGEPAIVSFDRDNTYQEHHIYLKIKSDEKAAQEGSNVPYRLWNHEIQKQIERDEATAREWADYNAQQDVMQTDPSAFKLDSSNHQIESENNSMDSEQDEDESEDDDEDGAYLTSSDSARGLLPISHDNERTSVSSLSCDFIESKVLEIDNTIVGVQEQIHSSVVATGSEIILNQESMEQNVLNRIGEIEQLLMDKSNAFDFLTNELNETKIKLKEVQFARDQEEQKRAAATQAYNKAMREKEQTLQLAEKQHRLEIQSLKQSAQFSIILKSIDQKLGAGMSELQAAMQFYEDSDQTAESDDDTGITADQQEVQKDTEMRERNSNDQCLFKVI